MHISIRVLDVKVKKHNYINASPHLTNSNMLHNFLLEAYFYNNQIATQQSCT